MADETRQIYQQQPVVIQKGEKVVPTVCSVNCESRCRHLMHVKDGKIVRVTPGEIVGVPGWANVCLRGNALPFRAQSNDRVKYPMKRVGARGEGKFERISWDEAFKLLAQKFQEIQTKYGPKSAGFVYMTGNQTKLAWESIERFSKCCGGTIYTLEALMSDHGASMGDQLVYGKMRGGNDVRDYYHSKLLILWGKNMGATQIQDMRWIFKAKECGCKVISIDPRHSQTATIADQWIPIRPATDSALALGLIRVIVSRGLHDKEWLRNYSCAPMLIDETNGKYLREKNRHYMVWDTNSDAPRSKDTPGISPALSGTFTINGVKCRTAFDHLMNEVNEYTLSRTAEITGIAEDIIEQLAVEYASAKPAAIYNSQGIQRVWNSFNPFRATTTLGAICGNIGKVGGGVSHGVGWGEGGLGDGSDAKDEPWDFSEWNDKVPEANWQHGSKVYEQIETAKPYPVKLAWIATFNWLNQGPDANRVINSVFPNLDFIVYVDPYMTWTSKYADLLLPCTSFYENWDLFVKPPWIFLQQPVIDPVGESKSDTQIFTELSKRLGLEKYWTRTDKEWVHDMLDTPKMRDLGFDWDEFVREGQWAPKHTNFVPPIDWENGEGYTTPTERFEFYTEHLVEVGHQVPNWTPPHDDPNGPLGKKYPLVCIQFHDLYTIHSQHTPNSPIKVVRKEAWIEMNPIDAQKRGIKHEDTVRAFNDRGECKLKAFVTEGIKPGVVAIPQGWNPEYYVSGHLNNLTYLETNPIEEEYIDESNTTFYDILVEIEKV